MNASNPAFSFLFDTVPPSAETDAQALKRLDRVAWFLDSALRVPVIGTRIGADALLNFVPGAGVVVAKGLSAWIIWEARRLGVPKAVLGKMLANLGVDFAISIVPVAGWVADAFFRANLRNMALLREHLEGRRAVYPASATAGRSREPVTIEGEWTRGPAR